MLGFDTAYNRDRDNSTQIDLSLQHERIILTLNLLLQKQSRVTHGYWLRHREPRQQLQEVLLALDLFRQLQAFTRCLDCNGQIHPIDNAIIRGQIDPNIFQRFREFWEYPDCRKIYWHC